MLRNLCLNCGAGHSPDANCVVCGITPERHQELERRAEEHQTEFDAATLLSVYDLAAFVYAQERLLVVHELIRTIHHPDSIFKESIFKSNAEGVIQLVHQRNVGTRLLLWPWLMKRVGNAAG